MKFDPDVFLHESDKAAMAALEAIPGFSQVMKAFMKLWNEQQFKIINMSTNLKLGKEQMSKYYNMLEPVCDKLGIEVPELYVKLDVNPNAYTYGDTKPFIVVTSGLFKTLPDELIPTVLAHECGHIACHHTLYNTMGNVMLGGASVFAPNLGLGGIAIFPIRLAFAYWLRCSEFSADRAAVICDGSSDRIEQVCMHFAGFDKDMIDTANIDAFMDQAREYRKLIDDSTFNKTMEFITFMNNRHPLNAVRALESREWSKTERFRNIMEIMKSPVDISKEQMPVEITPKKYLGKHIEDVKADLIKKGFKNITAVKVTTPPQKLKNGTVTSFSINGRINGPTDWFKRNSVIYIDYYESENGEEYAPENPFKQLGDVNFENIGQKINDIEQDLGGKLEELDIGGKIQDFWDKLK